MADHRSFTRSKQRHYDRSSSGDFARYGWASGPLSAGRGQHPIVRPLARARFSAWSQDGTDKHSEEWIWNRNN